MSRTIPLTQGYVAVVDDQDYDGLAEYAWRAQVEKNGVYACRLQRKAEHENGMPKKVYMHRQILGVTDRWTDVDHANRNGLDNRRANLRTCSRSENNGNRKKSGGTSRYKGVSWDSKNGKWLAQIHLDNKRRYLGRFVREEDAARAYDAAALLQWGEFARLNLPEVSA